MRGSERGLMMFLTTLVTSFNGYLQFFFPSDSVIKICAIVKLSVRNENLIVH